MAKILIVEDESEIAEIVITVLNQMDHQVVHSRNGLEGFLDVTGDLSEPYDLIITDLKMPKFSGEELLREIKAMPQLSETPIVIVSGYITDAIREQFCNTSMIRFLLKPFSLSDFRTHVSELLAQQKKTKIPV